MPSKTQDWLVLGSALQEGGRVVAGGWDAVGLVKLAMGW